MRLIPVIDLQHGQVVSAVGGQRDCYQPLRTPLSASTTFGNVADGLLQYAPSSNLYVADLDAIECKGSHTNEVLAYILERPTINVWLDSGLRELSGTSLGKIPSNLHVVVGTENFSKPSDLVSCLPTFDRQLVLSLDFSGKDFLGPRELLDQPGYWPTRVIVMSLATVGKGQGPDFKRITEIVDRADGREVYAAGGVRSIDDLRQLSEIGAAGALVATALHNGQIKTGDLEEIAGL